MSRKDEVPLPPLPDAVSRFLKKAAKIRLPVLLEGETGTGKTHLARLLHTLTFGPGAPFQRQSAADLSPFLIESTLFGHERGAFTGAKDARPGLLELADGGTLLVDEIAELPLEQQAKLLGVSEDGHVRRIAAKKDAHVRVRIIAATNQDLAKLVASGGFRRDLYQRLKGLYCKLLPLRGRLDQLGEIARYILEHPSAAIPPELAKGPVPLIDPATIEVLRRYPWPGNIRELAQVLEEAWCEAEGDVILPNHLRAEVREPRAHPERAADAGRGTSRYSTTLTAAKERDAIVAALKEAQGNRTKAASQLGMSRSTLWERIHRYGIDASEWNE